MKMRMIGREIWQWIQENLRLSMLGLMAMAALLYGLSMPSRESYEKQSTVVAMCECPSAVPSASVRPAETESAPFTIPESPPSSTPAGVFITSDIDLKGAILKSGTWPEGRVVQVKNGFRGTLGTPNKETNVCVLGPVDQPIYFTATVAGTVRLLGPCKTSPARASDGG